MHDTFTTDEASAGKLERDQMPYDERECDESLEQLMDDYNDLEYLRKRGYYDNLPELPGDFS